MAWTMITPGAVCPVVTSEQAVRRDLPVWVPPDLRLSVDQVDLTAQGLIMSGRSSSSYRDVGICLLGQVHKICVPVVWAEEHRWRVVVPLGVDLWGDGWRPLPSGKYALGGVVLGVPEARTTVMDATRTVVFQRSAEHLLPMVTESDSCHASIGLSARHRGILEVKAPLPAEKRDARSPRDWQQDIPLLGQGGLDDRTILLRSYYGEVANCNPLGVHHAIARDGVDLRVVWGVKDHSVGIPEGGVPVLIGSREWYETLATAKYSVWNVHQPDWYRKNPGQVMVQTFHGYPFKLAGMPYWPGAGFSQLRIQSFLERHTQWDYLVSPAPYATPLLERCFPGAQEILEIGYPRNDIFFDPSRDQVRSRTRSVLGIPDETMVVLYAPTYRDWLSDNETKARVSELLSPNRLASMLGPAYTVLMRGHPMEGRGGESRDSGAQVIDVTSYPRVEELCLASDIGVFDYSSLRFDYALTGNPMVFFVPDLDRYMNQERGSLIPYEGTAPGPQCRTIEELVSALRDGRGLGEEYRGQWTQFIHDFLPLEDGHAGSRLVRTLLEHE